MRGYSGMRWKNITVLRKIMWWFVAISTFSGLCAIMLDILMYSYGQQYMITADLQEYFDGSWVSFRAALAGFVCGSLLTHLTKWGDGKDLKDE